MSTLEIFRGESD